MSEMQIHEPAVLEITQGRKRTPLRWETREQGRELYEAIKRKNALLPGPALPGDADFIDAVIVDAEIDDDPEPPQDSPLQRTAPGDEAYRGMRRTADGKPIIEARGEHPYPEPQRWPVREPGKPEPGQCGHFRAPGEHPGDRCAYIAGHDGEHLYRKRPAGPLGWPVRTVCGARPYPAGSEGDDSTECRLPAGHDGPHDDQADEPGEHAVIVPYPDAPVPDALTGDGEAAADQPEPDVPAEAEPYPPRWVAPGRPRCKATAPRDGEPGDWWVCTAQPFHDGPDHVAHIFGGVESYRWPVDPAPCVRDDRHGPHGRCLGSLGTADGGDPYPAQPGQARCHARHDEVGEVWMCGAQHGHAGDVHVTYNQDGTTAHTWPVTVQDGAPAPETGAVAADELCHARHVSAAGTGYCDRVAGHDGRHEGRHGLRWPASGSRP